MSATSAAAVLVHTLPAAVVATGSALGWIRAHLPWIIGACTVLLVGARVLQNRLAHRVLRERVRFTLTPTRRFEPLPEQLWRYSSVLLRAAGSGPWWAPQRAKSVRVRLRADGTSALGWSIEGAPSARRLLAGSPYEDVTVTRADRIRDKARQHVVRAEFTVAGSAAAALREVPLEPDPLQPVVDAVAALRADLGDLAEVLVDLQPVPRWRMRLRRWQLMAEARERARTTARRESRMQMVDAADLEDSWAFQLSRLLEPGEGRGGARRLALPARPRPVSREQTLGRLGADHGVVRIQVLVRCCSDTIGRAEGLMQELTAAMDVFAGPSRLRVAARRIGPWTISADNRWHRPSFDRRWFTGLVAPRGENWVGIGELAGLLKPPTMYCRLPLLAADVPSYELGSPDLMPHGWHTAPDGTSRLIASPVTEALFSVAVGKATYGKTEKALVQAIALAHGGHGVMFVDPHSDTWKAAAPYLAHASIRSRVWRLDLTDAADATRIGGWNPLAVDRGQDPVAVRNAVVDAAASVMGWSDESAPRALTILIKCVEALVAVNLAAVAAGLPKCQATVFQIPTLLQNPAWRAAALRHLPAPAARWWNTTFTTYTEDAFSVVINPLERLASDRVARALLGTPTGRWDLRKAMDTRRVVWVCPAGTGPTDRLLVSLIVQDLYRCGLSRRDLDIDRRHAFFVFLDELISLDGAASATIAEITEELRKFGVRLHAMTQLLQRISATTRDSLLQNASILSTTSGSNAATKLITDEWNGEVDPAVVSELPKYHHYVSLTVDGKRIGPLKIQGPQVKHVFRKLSTPDQVTALSRSSLGALGGMPISRRLAVAAAQDDTVLAFLNHTAKPTRSTSLAKPAGPSPAAGRTDGTPESRHQ